MLSAIVPARNERYLPQTVADLLAHAVGDLEILVVLDGLVYPDTVLPADPRVRVIRHEEPHGMRPSINEAAAAARGDVLLKCDAHCSFAPGFDRVLRDALEPTWVMVPRRLTLHPETWRIDYADTVRDAHYLSYPFHDRTKPPVLRGLTWHARAQERTGILLDDEMTSQGSCWVMPTAWWQRLGPLDTEHYGPFVSEFQELGCKTWGLGGAIKVNKQTQYGHWYKRDGQGYALSRRQSREGLDYCWRHWFFDAAYPGKVRPFDWLIDHFWPVPGWPADWQAVRDRMRAA